jgi:hypothetical protein
MERGKRLHTRNFVTDWNRSHALLFSHTVIIIHTNPFDLPLLFYSFTVALDHKI